MFFPFRRGLNPQASEYIPRFHQSPLPLPFPSPPRSAAVSTFIPLHPPPCWSDIPYPNNTLLPPPPPPSHPLPPPPPPSHFISVPRNIPPAPTSYQQTELLPICVNRPNNVRVSRGTRVMNINTGRERRSSTTSNRGKYNGTADFGGRGRGAEGQYSNFREEKKRGSGNNYWSNLKKHGMRHLREDEYKTTVMIKNIPYEFTRQMLIDFMDKHCMSENEKSDEHGRDSRKILSAYDFLYLPVDFKTGKNKGYAFVNFTHPLSVWKFFNAFNSTKWESTISPKIRRIVCARIQGKGALVNHFQKTYFDCECDEFFPICFTPARNGCSGNRVKATTVGKHRD